MKVINLKISNCAECPYVQEICGAYWCNYDGEDGEFSQQELESPRDSIADFCPLEDEEGME